METSSPLGVEEWAFTQSTVEGEEDLDSLQRVLAMDNKRLETRNQQLAAENQQLKEENDRLKESMTARTLELEQQSQQLIKMKKDRTEKLLELELANKAQAQILKECTRLHKICLQQAAALVDARHKVHQQEGKHSRPADNKPETMEQWLRSGLKSDRKRCLQDMEEVSSRKSKKRLKTSSLQVEIGPKEGHEATTNQLKKVIETNKDQADAKARFSEVKPLAISSGAMWKEFELLDAHCSRAYNSLPELD